MLSIRDSPLAEYRNNNYTRPPQDYHAIDRRQAPWWVESVLLMLKFSTFQKLCARSCNLVPDSLQGWER